MKVVAIIGGIGSGKSEALGYLKSLGYPALSADEINRGLLLDREYIEEVTNCFPEAVESGEIVRAKLSDIIFSDPVKRKQLEGLAHPRILGRIEEEIKQARLQKVENFEADTLGRGRYLFVEVPLYCEIVYEQLFDYVWLVTAEEAVKIRRLKTQRAMSEEKISAIMKAQCSDLDRRKVANEVISNNAGPAQLKRQIDELLG